MAKKKRKLEESQGTGNTQDLSQQQSSQGGANGTSTAGSGAVKGIAKPVGKLKLEAPSSKENVAEPEKDDANGVVGMMSPESINGAG